jgi:hypothetical protein
MEVLRSPYGRSALIRCSCRCACLIRRPHCSRPGPH